MIINVYSGRCTPHLESITFLDSLDSRFHSRGSDFLDFWKMIFDDMMSEYRSNIRQANEHFTSLHFGVADAEASAAAVQQQPEDWTSMWWEGARSGSSLSLWKVGFNPPASCVWTFFVCFWVLRLGTWYMPLFPWRPFTCSCIIGVAPCWANLNSQDSYRRHWRRPSVCFGKQGLGIGFEIMIKNNANAHAHTPVTVPIVIYKYNKSTSWPQYDRRFHFSWRWPI